MRCIYKYLAPVESEFTINMPTGATILCVQTQNGKPRIWALVDPGAEPVNRTFYCYGTGHELPEPFNQAYIGTVQTYDGQFVWHYFQDSVAKVLNGVDK